MKQLATFTAGADREGVTKKQLQILIVTHEGRLQRATAILDENYYDFEQAEDQTRYQYWIGKFRKETMILEWLRRQKADDE